MQIRDDFYGLFEAVRSRLTGQEALIAYLQAEDSDFVRLNRSAIRQPGSVRQQYLVLELINGQRHLSAMTALTGSRSDDQAAALDLLGELRQRVDLVPEDPYLLYNTDVSSGGEQIGDDRLPDPADAIDAALSAGAGRDLVGIYASGGQYAGLATSLGQRNWFAAHTFSLDWCFYHTADKAVKTSYAGFEWDADAFAAKVDRASEQLEVLTRPAKTIEPGRYRVYLAPAAMLELMEMLCWGGFGLKAQRTKNTSLLKMVEDGRTLHPSVTIRENTREGIAPNFQGEGFARPDEVVLVRAGELGDPLVSPRSSKEYDVPCNGASAGEFPRSLDVAAGDMPVDEVLERLETGVYVNQLWYLNYSDRPAGRITGMTRFATFWVEGGRIVAPLNVMRFDETVYRVLGENLLALTSERDFIPSSSTYESRSTESVRVPGALVDDFAFTL
jgi:predicted Zn-dependent protease